MNSFDCIRKYYKVPAKRGGRVEYQGHAGKITGTYDHHLMIRLDGENFSKPYHPMDLEYMEAEGEKL